MTNNLTEEEKYRVLRPIIGDCEEDEYHFPIINKVSIKDTDWSIIEPIGFKNISAKTQMRNKLVLMFSYDKDLQRLWNNPLKYVPKFSEAAFISTPDFSVSPSMNYNQIRHNVYENRWLGKTWQNYGVNVLTTMQWCKPDTYDICFGGVEYGAPVIVSTLGCKNHSDVFLNGFNEMKKRINPELIVVYGDMISGMTGRFVNYTYTDAITKNQDYEQLSFFKAPAVFEIKEVN